jgi:hypothetical protein
MQIRLPAVPLPPPADEFQHAPTRARRGCRTSRVHRHHHHRLTPVDRIARWGGLTARGPPCLAELLAVTDIERTDRRIKPQ